MNKEENFKTPSVALSLVPVLFMIVILIVGVLFFNLKIEILLLLSAVVTSIIAVHLGHTYEEIEKEVVDKIAKGLPAIFVVLVVGILVGAWIIGGTVPYLVYIGLKIISPKFLLLISFLLCGIISMSTGTSWGAAGTFGAALMSIAAGMNFPLPLVAGAIISGCYIGDGLSPLGGEPNLVAMSADVDLRKHLKHLLWTEGTAVVLCALIYGVMGFVIGSGKESGLTQIDPILNTLTTLFKMKMPYGLLLLIPPAIVIYGMVKNMPIVPVMFASIGFSIFNAVAVQDFPLKSIAATLIGGFNLNYFRELGVNLDSLPADVSYLLNRGGLSSMLDILQVTFCAFAFVGALNVTGVLNVLLSKAVKFIKSTGQLIMTTALSGFVSIAIAGNNTICFILLGDLFQKEYTLKGLKKENLSRVIADSITGVEPIIPWSLAGVFMSGTLGVPTLNYLPWAFFCYIPLILTILLGFTGIGISKIEKGDNAAYSQT